MGGPNITNRAFRRGLLGAIMSPVFKSLSFSVGSSGVGATAVATFTDAAISSISQLSRTMLYLNSDLVGIKSTQDPNHMVFNAAHFLGVMGELMKYKGVLHPEGTDSLEQIKLVLEGRKECSFKTTEGAISFDIANFNAQIEELKAHAGSSQHSAGLHVVRWLNLLKDQKIEEVINDPVRILVKKYLKYLYVHTETPLSDAEAVQLREELLKSGIDSTGEENRFDATNIESAGRLIKLMQQTDNLLNSGGNRKCLPLPESVIRELRSRIDDFQHKDVNAGRKVSFLTPRMRKTVLSTFPDFEKKLHQALCIVEDNKFEKAFIKDWSERLTLPSLSHMNLEPDLFS